MSKPEPKKDKHGYQFTLTSYDPVVLEVPKPEITDEQIEAQLAEYKQHFPKYNELDRTTVQEGDAVRLDLVIKDLSDGKEIFTKKNEIVQLGKNYMPQQFESEIIGNEINKDYSVEFEEQGMPGQDPMNFRADGTLYKVYEVEEPEITDEWVKENLKTIDTVEDLKNNIREQLNISTMMELSQSKIQFVVSALADRLVESIPDELYEQAMAGLTAQFEYTLQQQNLTREQFLKQNGMDENSFQMQLLMSARAVIAQSAALDAYAHHYNIAMPLDQIGKYLGVDEPDFVDKLKKSGEFDEARKAALRQKAAQELSKVSKVSFKKD